MVHHRQGMTLIELLVLLAIIGVLATLAPPALSKWIHRQQARSHTFYIIQLVQYARIQAVERHLPVVICGGKEAGNCTHNWNHGILVFLDSNKNNQWDPQTDTLLRRQPAVTTRDGFLRWRAAFGRKYFRALPTGRVSFAGSFTYCPKTGDARYAAHIIISGMGRPRVARDRDHDGIVENARGKPVRCQR